MQIYSQKYLKYKKKYLELKKKLGGGTNFSKIHHEKTDFGIPDYLEPGTDFGIPDYLEPGTFLVLRPILYPITTYDDKLRKMVEEATKDKMGKIVIVPSKLDIDWGHYFILIPLDLIQNNTLRMDSIDTIYPTKPTKPIEPISYDTTIPSISLRYEAYFNESEFLKGVSKYSYPIMNPSLWLQTVCKEKHIFVSDLHGKLGHAAFLKVVMNALYRSHTDLIFEPLIDGSTEDPETRIDYFFMHRNPDLYKDAYREALRIGMRIIPGDFSDTQPGSESYKDYSNARYRMNKRVAEKIRLSDKLTISFYGAEHFSHRRK